MGGTRLRVDATGVALVAMCALVVAVALFGGQRITGVLPIDVIIVGAPLVILLGIPFLRRGGLPSLPGNGVWAPGLLFLFTGVASALAHRVDADVIMTIFRYATYLALMVFVGALAADQGRRRIICWTWAAAAAATVGVAVVWYVRTYSAAIKAAAELGGSVPQTAIRVESTFINSNFYAEFLVLSIGVGLYLMAAPRRGERIIAWAFTGLVAITLVLTYTRGSWLGLFVALALAALMVNPRYLLFLIGLPVIAVMFVPGVTNRIAQALTLEGSAGFRTKLWMIAGAAVADRPIFGWGLGRFYEAFASVVDRRPGLSVGFAAYGAHNSYLTLAAEAGIVCAVAFIWLIWRLGRISTSESLRAEAPRRRRLRAAALGVGLLAFALNGLTSNSFQHPQAAIFFWILAGILIGLHREQTADAPAADRVPSSLNRMFAGSWTESLLRPAAASFGRVLSASRVGSLLRTPPPSERGLVEGSWTLQKALGTGRP